MKHISFRSAAGSVACFKEMFPDSIIASKMQLQRTKVAYTIVHGLAPHFQKELLTHVKNADYLVVGFDESLNKVSQRQQMDIHVKFWDLSKNEVSTRYLSSVFLRKTCASDLLEGLKSALTVEVMRKVIQLSMDGPSVNMKLWKDFCSEMAESPQSPVLLNIGSCGLHAIHGAFKAGVKKTGWNIIEFLRAAYYLFKDSPARRATYTQCTESSQFPLKFCSIRWVENSSVVLRAQSILDHLTKFVNVVEKGKSSQILGSNSFKIISTSVKDKFLAAKLAFFAALADLVEPFLTQFQTDEPMAPFLHAELTTLVRGLFERIIKPDVIEAAASLKNIDLNNSSNLISVKKFDLGFSTRNALKKCEGTTELEILQFRKDCQAGLLGLLQKLMERSPLQYKLTRAISFLDPCVIAQSSMIAQGRLTLCLEIMVGNNWLSGTVADKIQLEYKKLCSVHTVVSAVKSYDRSNTRLDHFWTTTLQSTGQQSGNFMSLVKMILIMSHGNAFLERGFSINSECILENQSEESLVALRQVHDAVTVAGGVTSINVTKSLIHSARNAHARYVEFMEKRKDEEKKQKNALLSKKRAAEERKLLEAKKAKLLNETMKEVALIEDQLKSLSG